ncbi:MAG: hypothetical protein FWC38_00660 [Proteobacteria bacterium]|nr:hypothetical protein [Pseudomonadota bacterium]MCL2306753.1 hypothetical protein [Pseudomonadota bacterium]
MLTYRDLQSAFRTGWLDARVAGVKTEIDVFPMERCLLMSGSVPRHAMRVSDGKTMAYNSGLHAYIGKRKNALTFWQNAVYFGRPDGFVRRGRMGWRYEKA